MFSTTLVAFSGAPTFGWAANAKDAEVLVTKLVADINAVISSGIQNQLWLSNLRRFLNLMRMCQQLLDMLWAMMQGLYQIPNGDMHKGLFCLCFA